MMWIQTEGCKPIELFIYPEECKMERATSEREAEQKTGKTDPDKTEVNEVHVHVLMKLWTAWDDLEGKSGKEIIIERWNYTPPNQIIFPWKFNIVPIKYLGGREFASY